MRIRISRGSEDRRILLDDGAERAPDEDQFDFFVGGLVRRVRGEALAHIFSRYGRVTKAEPVKNYAFVNVDTTEERAKAAVAELSGSFQLENKLFVQFRKGSKYEHLNSQESPEGQGEGERRQGRPSVSDDGIVIVGEVGKGVRSAVTALEEVDPGEGGSRESYSIAPEDTPGASDGLMKSFLDSFAPKPSPSLSGAKEPSSADLKLIMATVQSAGASLAGGPVDEGPKAQRKFHVSGLNSRADNYDLKDLFGRYGLINRVDCKMTYGTYTRYGFVFIFCSEVAAVRCMCELDGHMVKGSKLKVSFMRGSYEDSKEFKEKWVKQIMQFSSPEHKAKVELELSSEPVPKMRLSEIGEGLSSLDMSLSLEPLHPSFTRQLSNPFADLYTDSCPAAAGSAFATLPEPCQAMGHQQPGGVASLHDVQGVIHSIQNKMVLLEFWADGVKGLAKLTPGQMYINGQQSLGFVIKSNAFHTWPKMVKDFLQIGRSVAMDLRRLTEKEMHEGKDRERTVLWTAPLLWQPGCKPAEADVTLTAESSATSVATAVVTKLLPTWGLLAHPQGDIVFRAEQVFWETAPLKAGSSIVADTDLEVGDRLAVHYRQSEPGEAAVAGAPLTSLSALLVWVVGSEVDPWVYHNPPTSDSITFLATSSTLARQLPGDAEAEQHNVAGEVEEVHLPAGGIIRLTQEAAAKLGVVGEGARVYFHRSRLHINGTKIQSDQRLDQELVLGDQVTVDMVSNRGGEGEEFVRCGAGWVALAVRCHTTVRGVQIANRLKQQVSCGGVVDNVLPQLGGGEEGGTVRARVVHLRSPADPRGAATAGVAVLDSGDFLGQRVEFDRSVCVAFGLPLARADLSHLFAQGEAVEVRLKPYNSYCVEKLWLGFLKGEGRDGVPDAAQHLLHHQWLQDKALAKEDFDMVVKGQSPGRLFLPLASHPVGGQVVEVREEGGLGVALSIRTTCGRLVTVDRAALYVFGRWMGRADISYCMHDEVVYLEVGPRYGGGEEGRAVLAWVGGEGDRPVYRGAATEPHLSDTTQAHLRLWLAGKNLDMSLFKAMVEGTLPSKKPAEKVAGEVVDQETLAQANILKKMKSQFGSEKMVTALMSMMQAPPAPPPPPTTPPGTPTSQARGYYSSGATTATYSSSPQPPSAHQPSARPQPYPAPQPPVARATYPAAQYTPQPLHLPVPYEYQPFPSSLLPHPSTSSLLPHPSSSSLLPHPSPSLPHPSWPQQPGSTYFLPGSHPYRK